MGIREAENDLFTEWAKKEGRGDLLVRDGVPDPEQFMEAKIKITFVLKEANDFNARCEGVRDMRCWVKDGACKEGRTWNNITRWTRALLEDSEFRQGVSIDDRKDWLKRISFMNLKKVSGGSSSDTREVECFAKEDANFLLKQLGIYQPDIIICCGIWLVAECLKKYVLKDVWEGGTCQKYRWFYTQLPGNPGKTAVLDFYHPLNLGVKKTSKDLFDEMRQLAPKMLTDRNRVDFSFAD